MTDQRPETGWKPSLQAFFDTRSQSIASTPTLADLCFIAGRDPRLWSDPQMCADLARSIVSACRVTPSSRVLEVGSAAGFLARLVAPEVLSYVGVDLSEDALQVARRLALPNASFQRADGQSLPFPDGASGGFDAVFCYDVYTNFPTFRDGAALIADMLRVAKPGAFVLVGSIPDAATEAEFVEVVPKVSARLEERYGPRPPSPHVDNAPLPSGVEPAIGNFYFRKSDFIELGKELGAKVEIADIHPLNPYIGYRFNAIYRRAG